MLNTIMWQEEPNLVLLLNTQAESPLDITRGVPQENGLLFGYNPLLTKFVRSRWLAIGLNQYLAILPWRSFNN